MNPVAHDIGGIISYVLQNMFMVNKRGRSFGAGSVASTHLLGLTRDRVTVYAKCPLCVHAAFPLTFLQPKNTAAGRLTLLKILDEVCMNVTVYMELSFHLTLSTLKSQVNGLKEGTGSPSKLTVNSHRFLCSKVTSDPSFTKYT